MRILNISLSLCFLMFIFLLGTLNSVSANIYPVHFIRGEVDQIGHFPSGLVNINDANYLLNYLFSGGPEPKCMDAADFNDDGHIDISDAIGIMNRCSNGCSNLTYVKMDYTPDNFDCLEFYY